MKLSFGPNSACTAGSVPELGVVEGFDAERKQRRGHQRGNGAPRRSPFHQIPSMNATTMPCVK
jgi:hypothetical protein